MLRSMKQKFGAKKEKERDAPSSAGSSRMSGVASKSHSAGPSRPTSAYNTKEKPPLPIINEQTMQQYYSDNLPSFREVPASEKQHLFVQKLHLCSFTFHFQDPTKYVREKEMKRQTLLELVEYANTGQGKFTEAVSEDIIFMLNNNLFRSLPPIGSHTSDGFDPEEEEPLLEAGWPHLQVSWAPGRVREPRACSSCVCPCYSAARFFRAYVARCCGPHCAHCAAK